MSNEQVKEPTASYMATVEEAIGDVPIAEITTLQLKALVQSAVREALQEVLDPDAGLELRPEFENRLRQAVAYTASGGHLLSMQELIDKLEGTTSV